MEKYRIDYAYEKVYIYYPDDNAYYFFGTFRGIGINNKMLESEMIEIIDYERKVVELED